MSQLKSHQTTRGQEALKWLDDNSLLSVAISAGPGQQRFVPSSLAREHFTKDRLESLLEAVCPPGFQCRQISLDIVNKGYVLIFLILLRLNEAAMIKEFLFHARFSDRYLPFDEHTRLPPGVPKEQFLLEQQPFCAVFIRQGEEHFQSQSILPIMRKEEIAHGGSAIVYRIEIHPEYDKLERIPVLDADNGHVYVMKTFSEPDAEKSFEAEKTAYSKVVNSGQWIENFAKHHGSYVYRGERFMLLQYANKGTWEKFMKSPPPERLIDILHIWRGLLSLAMAVDRIHVAHGWHQDINPNNVVLHDKPLRGHWEFTAKLVDLGRSYFFQGSGSDFHDLAPDRYGTKEYGAPECYRSTTDDYEPTTRRYVPNSIDVFSLGCVFLEAAVWLREGADGVQRFRDSRRDEAKSTGMEEGIAFFHDGTKLLGCVKSKLDTLHRVNDLQHKLSASICDELILGMLHCPAQNRLKADRVWQKAVGILNAASNESTPQCRPLLGGLCRDRAGTSPHERLDGAPHNEDILGSTQEFTQSPVQQPSDLLQEPGSTFTLYNEDQVWQWEEQGARPPGRTTVAGPSRRSPQVPQTRIIRRHTGPGIHRVTNRSGAGSSTHMGDLPEMSVFEAAKWPEKRYSLSVKESQLRMKLDNRDHAFILDNSYSTARYWEEMCALLRILTTVLQGLDPDGMELRFTTSRSYLKSNNISQLHQTACQEKPNAHSNVEDALDKAVEPHETRLRQGDMRPLTVYVLTDGNWMDGNPEAVLLRLQTLLGELRLQRLSLGIQFIRFGNVKEGMERLNLLDEMHKSFDLPMDIVDTVPSNGNVWKMLLGAILSEFDEA